MKIACFWAEERSLDNVSFRHEHLLEGFTALGHVPELVTASHLVGRFVGAVRPVDDLDRLGDAAFWKLAGFDLAVGLTWLRKSAVLLALASAGVPRVAIADSDGQLGYAAHPRLSWERIAHSPGGARARLRAAVYFVRRYLASRARTDAEELDFVASAEASTAIAFAGEPAIARFRRFLAAYGREELAARAFAAPYPVPREFREAAIMEKEERIVAVGRWSDPQKNAPLLAAALRRLLRERPTMKAEIFGADAGAAFGALAAHEPNLELCGIQEPHVVRAALARARILAIPSRWETGPHAAGEALALGTTLASTPLPTVEGLLEGGISGSLATEATPAALARALASEADSWSAGRRSPAEIAGRWRARLSPEAYCRRLLESVGG